MKYSKILKPLQLKIHRLSVEDVKKSKANVCKDENDLIEKLSKNRIDEIGKFIGKGNFILINFK